MVYWDQKAMYQLKLWCVGSFGIGKSAVDNMVNQEADIFNEFLKGKDGQLVDIKVSDKWSAPF